MGISFFETPSSCANLLHISKYTRKVVQPMGRLSKHSKCLDGGRTSFHFFFVPNMFPSSSQWVPIRLPICSLGSQCISLGCSQSHMFCPKSSLSHTYIAGPKGSVALHSLQNLLLWGASIVSTFFNCHGPMKLAQCKKQKVGLVRHPKLINMKHNKYPQKQGRSAYRCLFGTSVSHKNQYTMEHAG